MRTALPFLGASIGRGKAALLGLQLMVFAVLPVASVVVALVIFADQNRIALDFTTTYNEAKLVADGISPYVEPDADVSDGSIRAWPMAATMPAIPLTLLSFDVARWIVTALVLASLGLTLVVLGVRDWRVGGVLLLWPTTIDAYQTANVSAALGLFLALAWRYRRSTIVAGVSLGLAIALKFFLWPVVAWYALTRRLAAAALASVLAACSLLLMTPFISVPDYLRLVGNLSDTFDDESYTPYALLVGIGLEHRPARIVTLVLAMAVFAVAVKRRSLALAVASAFLFSPIVWRHYFVVLAVPLAVSYPRLHPAWAIPLGFWLVPGTYNGGPWHVAAALVVGAATVILADRGKPPDKATRFDRVVPRKFDKVTLDSGAERI